MTAKTKKMLKKPKKIIYSYILFFDKKISIKAFSNTESWMKSRLNFLNILRMKWTHYKILEWVSWPLEKELKIASSKPIKKNDVEILINLVISSLASWENLSSLSKYIADYKEFIKIHPLIIYLVSNGTPLLEVLKLLDFDFKQEIIQILSEEHETPEEMYKKLNQILIFRDSLSNLKWKLVWLWWKFAWYAAVSISLVFWLKYKLIPLSKEKIWMFLPNIDQVLKEPEALANYVLYIYSWIVATILFFIILRLFSKKRFNILMMKIPIIKDIYIFWNTIKWLVIFSFYYNNTAKLKEKLWDIVIHPIIPDYKIEIKENIEEIYLNILKNIYKSYGVNFFYIIWILWLKNLVESSQENRQKVINSKINVYLEKIEESQEKLWSILNVVLFASIWIVVWVMFMAIFSITFWSMSLLQKH